MGTVNANQIYSPDVSIIIPTYNGEKFISETIESVISQSYTEWELIIVDDGSTDNSYNIAKEYSIKDHRIKLIYQDNMGESQARNTGYSNIHHNSQYIIFLDHDDTWDNETLHLLRKILISNPSVIGVYGNGRLIDMQGNLILEGQLESWCRNRKTYVKGRWIDLSDSDETNFSTIALHNTIPTPGICLFRRQYLPPNPLFPSHMRAGSGDVQLFLRLSRYRNFVFLDKVLLNGRRHANNITNNGRRNDITLLEAYKNIMNMPDTTSEQRSILSAGYKMRYYIKSKSHLKNSMLGISRLQLKYSVLEFIRGSRSLINSIRGIR